MRAATLSNDTVMSLLNGYCVPVYISNAEYGGSGSAPQDERQAYGNIYRAAHAKKLRVGTVWGFICTPEGDPIDSLYVGGPPEQLIAALKKAIEKLGTREGKTLVEPRWQNPPPKMEPDALALHLTARPVAGSNGTGFWHGLVVENWIVYSRQDWTKFLPAAGAAPGTTPSTPLGTSWDVDRAVATQLLNHFYPNTENNDISKNEIEAMSMKATLVANGKVRLDVTLRMKHAFYPPSVPQKGDVPRVDAVAVGVVDFDASKRVITKFRMATEKATYNSGVFGVAVRSHP